MPIFITQGRYTRDAVKGMVARPEDRREAVEKLIEGTGGKVIGYYMTFGEYDFLLLTEGPPEGVAASLIAAAAGGGVSDLKTTMAMTSAQMRDAFQAAGPIAARFRSAGVAA